MKSLTTPFGTIASPWIPILEVAKWINRWFGVTPSEEWTQFLASTVLAGDGRVQHRVQGFNPTDVKVLTSTATYPFWLQMSASDDREVIVGDWDDKFFDPQTFTIAGKPQPDGRTPRHQIEVRSDHVRRFWLDYQEKQPRQNPVQFQLRRGNVGAPPKHDWEAFWREVVRYADLNGIKPEYRTELHQHMVAWAARTWPNPPDDSTVRARLKLLFDAL